MGTALKSQESFNTLFLAFDRAHPSALEYSMYKVMYMYGLLLKLTDSVRWCYL